VAADLRAAVVAAGASPGSLPSVPDALAAFGRMAAVEVAAVCDLAAPRAHAALWELALEFRARPDSSLAPALWSAA
jgi:hypothetical protein